jgi:hypothetical protein
MSRQLKIGNRVRAKARTIDGWKGTGTYIGDGMVIQDFSNIIAEFCDYELAKMRDQIPNPRHVAIIGESNDTYEIRARVYGVRQVSP